ncbi:Poly(A) polymeras-like protein [Delitschia confertaspora ATCC 74209]|uniref:Poly(A) polymerase n=1 Tax=Delitschia confertaspora ATCC 74209 TaxID=1513339 RepID=A0A9P4JIV4_9PLEO|nr:Poly(A) polymeras-like protein [Delitschia confertaspora ATCC 74209]
MAEQPKQWGITNIINANQPTPEELKLNDELLEYLKRERNFETAEGILNHFQKVSEEFIRRAGKAKGLAQSVIDNSGGKIFTFGSYALGVYGPGSDIDTLICAPKHVNAGDFFRLFPPTLREMSADGDIEELNPVPDAFVPIIKLEFRKVSIDLIFVSMPTMSSIPKDLKLSDKNILRGLDDSGMRSVNGTRVTEELLGSVPQVKTFRYATRALKLWANRRGVYGAVYGFPGGVAWAIMVARICQLYPFACGATIVSKFFHLLMNWCWPTPVLLKHIEEGTMGLKVWNPQIYHGDRAHLMPIITPAFPSMCSTHTITHSTKKTLMQEFKRADQIVKSILAGQKTWEDLFAKHTFFTKDHKYYLSVIAASRTKESHSTWSGWVTSRVRLLAKGIDESDAGVECARPFVKSFERTHRCKTEDDIERVVQGNMTFQVKDKEATVPNEDGDSSDGDHIIYTTTFYIGITLHEGGGRQLDISYPVSEFKRTIMAHASYDENIHSIRIVHTRNFDLPDDVFDPGEVRPTKPKKLKAQTTKTQKTAATTAKRSFAETGLDVGKPYVKDYSSSPRC